MESTPLNSLTPEDDGLDALLRQAAPVLPDHGFSRRVLAALPVSEAKSKRRWRIAVCLVGAAGGCGFASWLGVSGLELNSALTQFVTNVVGTSPVFENPLVGGALVVTAYSLLFAFRVELRDRLMAA